MLIDIEAVLKSSGPYGLNLSHSEAGTDDLAVAKVLFGSGVDLNPASASPKSSLSTTILTKSAQCCASVLENRTNVDVKVSQNLDNNRPLNLVSWSGHRKFAAWTHGLQLIDR